MDYPTESIHKEILLELETPNQYFSDNTINHFITLVRASTTFDMNDVLFFYFAELYEECRNKDDVQILYGGEIGENKIGHFICIFYREEIVHVYDSLNKRSLHERQIQIINNRYPNRKDIIFVEPKTTQIDYTSCGPLTIAYATILILGQDPTNYSLKMDSNGTDHSSYLRKHIKTMFESRQLLHFPQSVKNEL